MRIFSYFVYTVALLATILLIALPLTIPILNEGLGLGFFAFFFTIPTLMLFGIINILIFISRYRKNILTNVDKTYFVLSLLSVSYISLELYLPALSRGYL